MTEVCVWTKGWRAGAAWVAQNLVQAIAEEGGTVTFIAPRAEPQTREPHHVNLTRIVLPRELVGDQAASRIKRIRASWKRTSAGLAAVLRERSRTRAFIVAIPEPFVFTIPLLALLRLSGAKIIFLAHDVIPHAWRFGPHLRWFEKLGYALCYDLASSVVVMTPALRQALIDNFAIDAAKVHVIPHGAFDLGEIPPLPGKGRFFQFGTIRRNKSVLEVIQGIVIARRKDREVTLVIAGEAHPQEPDYWTACRAAMAEDSKGFDIRAGFLKDDELPPLVAEIDAFMLAYQDFDSQSGVGVIAGTSGRAVIATRSGGLADLFQHGMCGEFIEMPITGESVAAAIAAFRAKPADEWRERCRIGQDNLRRALSWSAIARAYLVLIRNDAIDRR